MVSLLRTALFGAGAIGAGNCRSGRLSPSPFVLLLAALRSGPAASSSFGNSPDTNHPEQCVGQCPSTGDDSAAAANTRMTTLTSTQSGWTVEAVGPQEKKENDKASDREESEGFSDSSSSSSGGGGGNRDPFDLESRFVTTHTRHYATALKEIQNGQKRSCWSWHVGPMCGCGPPPTPYSVCFYTLAATTP